MKRRTAIIFYILGGYVLLQFSWWAYHLVELTQNADFKGTESSNKVFMILSEGLVFFLLILAGLWIIRRSIRKELLYSDRQKNFLLSVTHELKTPIAANQLLLQTLKKRALDDDKRGELLDRALSENKRLEALIDNILNAAKIDSLNIQTNKQFTTFDDFVKSIVDNHTKTQGLEPVTIAGETETQVYIDGSTMGVVLINLLENARKYGGGQPYRILLEETKTEIICSVCDDGEGVPVNMQQEIFNKFVRVGSEETRTQKGTGLGLFIAKEFAALNGATLSYDSQYKRGAKFDLKIKK